MDPSRSTADMGSDAGGKHSIHTSDHGGSMDGGMKNAPRLTPFQRIRRKMTEYAGEFFGTMVLVIIGNGANCQVLLGSDSRVAAFAAGNWTSLSLAWATAVAMGVWISGGGHVNPAVTLAFATWRSFPWRKVPGYVVAQLLGAIVGAAIVYATYFHAIDIVEGGNGIRTMKTAGLFGTFPAGYLTAASCFFAEFLNTFILLFGILALTDTSRACMPAGLLPIGVWILVYGIGSALGFQTGFALNPARDLGPRILTAMVGYGRQVFSARNHYWIWTPIIATTLGALTATAVYDLFLYKGHESRASKWFGIRNPSHGNTRNEQTATQTSNATGSDRTKGAKEPNIMPV